MCLIYSNLWKYIQTYFFHISFACWYRQSVVIISPTYLNCLHECIFTIILCRVSTSTCIFLNNCIFVIYGFEDPLSGIYFSLLICFIEQVHLKNSWLKLQCELMLVIIITNNMLSNKWGYLLIWDISVILWFSLIIMF